MYRSPALAAAALFAAAALTACTSSSGPAPTTTRSDASQPVSGPHTSQSGSPSPTASQPPSAVKTFTKVTGTATTLHFDAGFVRILYTHGVSTTATGQAKLVAVPGSSNAVLPITAGSASIYKAAARTRLTLQHDTGGLTVGSDAGAVRVSDLALDLGNTPVMTARLVVVSHGKVSQGQPLRLFTLQRTTAFRTTTAKNVVTVTGLRLYLTAAAGKVFDRALNATVFVRGTKQFVGTVTAVVRGH